MKLKRWAVVWMRQRLHNNFPPEIGGIYKTFIFKISAEECCSEMNKIAAAFERRHHVTHLIGVDTWYEIKKL